MSIKTTLNIPSDGYTVHCVIEVSLNVAGGNADYAASLTSMIATAVTRSAIAGHAPTGTVTMDHNPPLYAVHHPPQYGTNTGVIGSQLAYQQPQEQVDRDGFGIIPAYQQPQQMNTGISDNGLAGQQRPEQVEIILQGFDQEKYFTIKRHTKLSKAVKAFAQVTGLDLARLGLLYRSAFADGSTAQELELEDGDRLDVIDMASQSDAVNEALRANVHGDLFGA
ncbi:hypothetical protein LTR36_002356 [Oleoguttula mirabilis]|uniref:Ubiquitin-like domain-containing protein n=1 Tax=Oleoguttula mirabilis TaxID=1507867 RepID=A0AAV9JMD7_9PEZI|nr:hypothetical protein LTR36_002356 [Oleoguttula mirabilis]